MSFIIICLLITILIAQIIIMFRPKHTRRNPLIHLDTTSATKTANTCVPPVEYQLIDNPKLKLNPKKIPVDRQLESFTHPNKFYRVSIESMTCSCPDFINGRNEFEFDDPRRICKHLFRVIEAYNLDRAQSSLFLSIAESPARQTNLLTLKLKDKPAVSFNFGEEEWVNVFASIATPGNAVNFYKEKYQSYGYNKLEQRWSYGDPPDFERTVIHIMDRLGCLI